MNRYFFFLFLTGRWTQVPALDRQLYTCSLSTFPFCHLSIVYSSLIDVLLDFYSIVKISFLRNYYEKQCNSHIFSSTCIVLGISNY